MAGVGTTVFLMIGTNTFLIFGTYTIFLVGTLTIFYGMGSSEGVIEVPL